MRPTSLDITGFVTKKDGQLIVGRRVQDSGHCDPVGGPEPRVGVGICCLLRNVARLEAVNNLLLLRAMRAQDPFVNWPRNGQSPNQPPQHQYPGHYPGQVQYPARGQYHGQQPQPGWGQGYSPPPPRKKSEVKPWMVVVGVLVVVGGIGSTCPVDEGESDPAVSEAPHGAAAVQEEELREPVVSADYDVECPAGKELQTASLDPGSGRLVGHCTIPFRVVTNEDEDIPLYHSRIRGLVVDEKATEADLQELLAWYYPSMRRQVMAGGSEHKKVFVYVYPNEKRAKAGLGEWTAMVGVTGKTLPETVEPAFKLPSKGAKKPSPKENAVYDDLQKELFGNPDEDEDRIMKRVAKRHRMSVKKLDAIQLKVLVYRSGAK